VEALRTAGAEILGLGAIFTYGFEKSVKAFEEANCKFFTLSNYESLLDKAIENDYAKAEDKDELVKWYKDPEVWGK
jgi:orotate phosphoribosyltransferase